MRHSEREASGSGLLVIVRAHGSKEVGEQERTYARTGEGLKGSVNKNEGRGGGGGGGGGGLFIGAFWQLKGLSEAEDP